MDDTFNTNIHTPFRSPRREPERKDDFKFSLAANSAINLFCHEDGKFHNHPVSEVVTKWRFRAATPPLP